jgi:two-component system response regulator YesN
LGGGGGGFFVDNKHDIGRIEESLQKLAAAIGVVSSDAMERKLEEIFHLENIPREDRGWYCFFINEWLESQASSVYWNYMEHDMYLSIKKVMIETPERFTSFFEWKKHVSDFIFYLHALIRKEHPKYAFIGEALAWIDNHFSQDINMTMAANHVSVNYTWFSEKFSEHTGMHFSEYLKRLRVEKAKAILESGSYMVYEAARLSGYQDVKYFQKAFKEVTGISPGEWRREKKSKTEKNTPF